MFSNINKLTTDNFRCFMNPPKNLMGTLAEAAEEMRINVAGGLYALH